MLAFLAFVASAGENIHRKACGAIIGSNDFDLNELMLKRPADTYKMDVEGKNIRLYSKICGSFEESEVPSYFTDYKYWSLAVCDEELQKCYGLASMFSQNYELIDPRLATSGVVVSHDGDPRVSFGSVPEDWIAYYIVRCDDTQNDPTFTSEPRVSVVDDVYNVYYELPYSGACPVWTESPTPTPAYQPMCTLDARNPSRPGYGFDLDLADLNVPGGTHMYKTSINGVNKTVLYQPCERYPNPFDRTDNTLSSLWVCTEQGCEDFGVADEKQKIEYSFKARNDPINVSIKSNSRTRNADITMVCNSAVFSDHIELLEASGTSSDIHLTFQSANGCERPMPPPVPPAEHCYFMHSAGSTTYTFNASNVDTPSDQGYIAKVRVQDGAAFPTKTLRYRPCSAIPCPVGAYCQQYEDAHIWLCDNNNSVSDSEVCQAFGLYEKNITMEFADRRLPSEGVVMKYKGGGSYSAEVRYICNPDVAENTIILPDHIDLVGSVDAQFTVESSRVCFEGPAPSPKPIFYPPWINKGNTPTPTPLPSPNSIAFYANNTHYIMTDLSKSEQIARTYQFVINTDTERGNIREYFSPFESLPCPSGFMCNGLGPANGWTCWTDKNDARVCFPTADHRYGYSMFPFDTHDLDRGATIKYEGAHGVHTEIKGRCSVSATPNLDFSGEAYFNYRQGAPYYSFLSETSLTCPRAFSTPINPEKRPTPTPIPGYEKKIKTKSVFQSDSRQMSLDLTSLPKAFGEVAIGSQTCFEKTSVLYSPYKRVQCPSSYDCQGYEDANIWKCFVDITAKCFPIGDLRYGFEVNLVNKSLLDNGISLHYNGGALQSQTYVYLQCNEDVPTGSLLLDKVGDESVSMTTILYAHTSDVCPRYIMQGPVTKGAVFLLSLIVLALTYLSLGVFCKFILEQEVSLPNKLFWSELGACIADGIVFVTSFGKKLSSKSSGYEAA